MQADILTTTCCVVGGGPAGMVLGLLLARAGIDVIVLEKHGDFLRDFRGDTVHLSTLQIMHELGLLQAFLARPHQEVRTLAAQIGNDVVRIGDFTHLPTQCKFIALMPQWDFLDFLAEQAKRLPNFHLLMRTEGTGLLRDGGDVVGVTAESSAGPLEIRASLVIATDGRHSTMRDAAGLTVIDHGAPMDVLWLRVSRRADDPGQTLGRINAGHMLVTLDRGDYWQCAYLIPKGGFDALRRRGLDAFRAELVRMAPHFQDRQQEVADWDDVKLLTVAVNRLQTWYQPGLLLIGDAAHAMSPIGGVGINLAVQDAVATANLLAPRLRRGTVSVADLRAVQRRRELPARLTQSVQIFVQNRVVSNVLQSTATLRAPWLLRMLGRYPLLQRLPARMVGWASGPSMCERFDILQSGYKTQVASTGKETSMTVLRASERPTKTQPVANFTGTVFSDEIVVGKRPSRMRASVVSFTPGARTAWHSHPVGQTLYCLSGAGRVQFEGQRVQALNPGDTVQIPPDTRHWHGAAPGKLFAHLAMSELNDQGEGTAWFEYVSDGDYNKPPVS